MMPGMLRCGQSRNSPNLIRRTASRALLVCQFIALLTSLPHRLPGQTSAAPGNAVAATALNLSPTTRRHLSQHQQRSTQPVQVNKLIEFLQERDPDTLRELDQACRQEAANVRDLMRCVFSVYIELRQLQTDNVAEFERVLSVRVLEGECRRLAARIRLTGGQPSQPLREDSPKDDAIRLKRLLEEVFDSTQANQLIEVNRLEAEVRELRRHLEDRERNRTAIVETRFAGLTGLALP